MPSWARPGPSLPLPTGLGPPESSTGPSPVDTFTLPPFLPSRARPGSSPLDLWQCKRGYRYIFIVTIRPSYNYDYFVPIVCQAAVSVKISSLRVCFCSFDLSCPILEKDNFIEHFILYCLVLLNSGGRCILWKKRSLMVRWIVGSILHGRPIELYFVPASTQVSQRP